MQVPQTIIVDENIKLERIEHKHAAKLFALVEANRKHLGQWLPWVSSMTSVQHFEDYIRLCSVQHEKGTDASFMIIANGEMAGRIGLHYIHQHNRCGAVGYWLAEDFTGKGIMKKCCIALTNFGFDKLNLNRIEIKCAVGNTKSAAIPMALNFKHEALLEQAEWLNDKFIDLHLYVMLKEDWVVEPVMAG